MKSNRRIIACSLACLFAATAVPSQADERGLLLDAAAQYSPEYTRHVVRRDGTPLAVFGEFNGDDRVDVAILSVLREEGVPATVRELQDPSRMYQTMLPDPLFVVETYFDGEDSVHLAELGRNPVFVGMSVMPLATDAPLPVAIDIATRSATGTERTLLIYSAGGTIRHLTLQESDRYGHQFVDLNEDGLTDVVQTSRLPEAGRGYETFMELMMLDRGGYHTRASFGLVRELQRFLADAAAMMEAGAWDSLRSLVDPEDGTAPDLGQVFMPIEDEYDVPAPDGSSAGGPVPPGPPPAGLPGDDSPDNDADARQAVEPRSVDGFDYARVPIPVDRVVFPLIAENPFPYPYLGCTFTVIFRVECCGGFPRFFSALVRLSRHPFDGKRFAFLTDAHSRQ